MTTMRFSYGVPMSCPLNPAFTAPVTRAYGGDFDLFSIHATVVP